MIILRSIACPTWRYLGQRLTKPIIRSQTTTTSPFSNIRKSFTQNVLIFEHNDRILPILGAIGLIQFLALDFVAYWSFYLFGTVTAKEENLTSNSSLLERAATIVPTTRFRYVTNGLIVLLSKHEEKLFWFCFSSLLRWCYIWCLSNLSSEMYTSSLSTQGWFVDWNCHLCSMAECSKIYRSVRQSICTYVDQRCRNLS